MQRILLEDSLRQWRQEMAAAGRARGTQDVRVCHVRRVLKSLGMPVQDIRRRHLITWLAESGYAPETRRQVIISLRRYFEWLLDERMLAANPAEKLPAILRPRAIPLPAADYQIIQAIRIAPNWVSLAVEIMATCGLRRFEVAKLKSNDATQIGGHWTLRIEGKGGHTRVIPCPPHIAIRIHKSHGYVFPGNQNGHISPNWLGKQISKHLPDGVTSHKLRHRFASVAYQSGKNLRAVQELLGHASVATTQVYTAVDPSDMLESASAAWRIEGG